MLFVLGISTACFFSSCGVQGPPRPPRVEQPQRITDLAVTQVGRAFQLSFTLPRLATDEERLTKPLEIEIFRSATLPGQTTSSGFLSDPWVRLTAADLNRLVQGQKIVYAGRLSEEEFKGWQGTAFAFMVRALTRGFRGRPITSEFSNVVQTVLLDVSEPVENLRAQVTEQALELNWTQPRRSLSGQEPSNLSVYRVYWSNTGEPGSFQQRAEVHSPPYLEREFRFDRTYFFKVRAVSRQGNWVAESEDSAILEVTPRDIFPPAAPSGLTGVHAAGVVELIWTASTEPDLAGYNVYRSEEGGPRQRLNQELLRTPIFRDDAVKPDRKYSYQVTAVDLASNESSPSSAVLVESR